jgi:hypothetical protein
VAFNAAPGTIAPDEDGPYGAYAQALAEMMREGGLALPQVFERARLRVSDMTKGAQLPWFSSRLDTAFLFFERSPDAPAAAAAGGGVDISSRSIRDLPDGDAYMAAVERDTLQAYEEFLAAFPDHPLAKRVRAIIAARREAITWQRTYAVNTPNAYWSYLRRYPHGPHGADARRRLALGAFALEPPPSFDLVDYDVPPPPAEEEIYVERPVLAFDDLDLGFVPPPPLPVYFLPPPAADFVELPAPLPAVEDFVLPVPVFIPIPAWCNPPDYIVPPPNNVIFTNIHNTIIVNRETNLVTIRNGRGESVASKQRGFEQQNFERRASEEGPSHGAAALRLAGPALVAPLPPSLAQKRALVHPQESTAASLPAEGASKPRSGQPLPGMHGQPLSPLSGRSGIPSALAAAPPSAAQDSHALHLAPAHDTPSRPANRSSNGTLGSPLPGMHGQPLPPVPGGWNAAPIRDHLRRVDPFTRGRRRCPPTRHSSQCRLAQRIGLRPCRPQRQRFDRPLLRRSLQRGPPLRPLPGLHLRRSPPITHLHLRQCLPVRPHRRPCTPLHLRYSVRRRRPCTRLHLRHSICPYPQCMRSRPRPSIRPRRRCVLLQPRPPPLLIARHPPRAEGASSADR